MMFVDGENFAINARKFAERESFELREGKHYMRDVFAWFPEVSARKNWEVAAAEAKLSLELQPQARRSFYYTSLVGDDVRLKQVRQALHALHFEPQVFKKIRPEAKSKGVDLTLATDMLCHAFNNSYDLAVLVAGDADYVPLVREVKRRGKLVLVAFFTDGGLGFSEDLELVADHGLNLSGMFAEKWKAHLTKPTEQPQQPAST
jgi:uncharacterized LabA/DUF88 family protein